MVFTAHQSTGTATNLAAPYFQAPPPRSAEVVLYLDFDGVLQHQAVYWHPRRGAFINQREAPGHTLFEWTHFLEQTLAGFPDVRLILSSTWCIAPGYGKALKRLPESLRSKFIGGTFHRRVHGADPWIFESFRRTPRWLQIWGDVKRRKPVHWLALDDDVSDWPREHLKNLVACDGNTGLSCVSVQAELREKLALLT
ncbi:HAD domain-containing protein [Acidovorax sp. SUPP1855]|uniref:HAD domain-containing protein n=1 Tax=Acidovorax sp. SUPP1855 TaxID=431774 RepID=UPI0024E14971|nr:HAD domain-containing protein [Acidovorax sp. SUPP1855]